MFFEYMNTCIFTLHTICLLKMRQGHLNVERSSTIHHLFPLLCLGKDGVLKGCKPLCQHYGNQVLGGAKVDLYLGGGFRYFLFSPLPGEMIQFD